MTETANNLIRNGMLRHQQGELDKALDYYLQAIELDPENNRLLILTGTLLCQKKEFSASCSYYSRVSQEYGNNDLGYNINYGMALMSCDCYSQAAELLRHSTELDPFSFEALFNLGLCYYKQNLFKYAVYPFQQALKINPVDIQAQGYLGASLIEIGEHTEGLRILELSFDQTGETPFLRYNIGRAFESQENLTEALEQYKRALILAPDDFSTQLSISRILARLGKFALAEETVSKLLTQEDPKLKFSLLLHLCTVMHSQGDNTRAEEYAREALAIIPDSPEAAGLLALALSNTGHQLEAADFYNQAADVSQPQQMHLINQSKNYAALGMVEDAVKTAQEAFSLDTSSADAFSNLLLYLNYLSDISEDIRADLHRQFGDVFSRPQPGGFPLPADSTKPEIGIISGDLCTHPVCHFILPVLKEIQKNNELKVVVFSNNMINDHITAQIRQYVNEWHDIRFLTDHQAYSLIFNRNLDLLIDLSGHTSNNRLQLLAMKPCRKQLNYLGYPNTTGLKEMDYRLTDAFADQEGADCHYREKLCRMKNSFLLYAPPAEIPASGHNTGTSIMFGSFNNIAKISRETLKMWAVILNNVPESKLTLKCSGLNKETLRTLCLPKFAVWNISEERLVFRDCNSSFQAHLQEYENIDIALDTFPYNGTTTTFEALLMGCPVISRSAGTHASSVGKSILANTGLTELLADSAHEYIDKAVNLSQNKALISEYHKTLSERLLQSPLCNSNLFYQNLIAVLQEIDIIK